MEKEQNGAVIKTSSNPGSNRKITVAAAIFENFYEISKFLEEFPSKIRCDLD